MGNIKYSKKTSQNMLGKLFGGKFKPTRIVIEKPRGTSDPVQQVDCFIQNFATLKSALSEMFEDEMQKEAFKTELATLGLNYENDIADIFIDGDEDLVKEVLGNNLEYEDQKKVMEFLEEHELVNFVYTADGSPM